MEMKVTRYFFSPVHVFIISIPELIGANYSPNKSAFELMDVNSLRSSRFSEPKSAHRSLVPPFEAHARWLSRLIRSTWKPR